MKSNCKGLNHKKIIAMIVVASSIVSTTPAFAKNLQSKDNQEITYMKNILENEKQDFGVSQGIKWPERVNSPYVDMVSWITKDGYNNNGAPNLVKLYEDTGVKFFNLGFIQSTGKGIQNGRVDWGWGGYSVLNETGNDNDQYQGIKKSIKEIRELGGDVAISLGGLNGTAIWQVTNDVEALKNTYLELIEGYGITRLDLDIEGGAQNKEQNIANAKAIKKAQELTNVDVVVTLPVLPTGLTKTQLDVLEAYLSNGVSLKVVNIMAMCYGSSALEEGENYGTASLRAVENTKNQLKDYYKKFANKTISDEEAYGKIGTTVSIGFEGDAHPIFSPEWSKLVVDQAIDKKIAMTSFWSLNRDAKLEDNRGVTNPYQFTNEFKKFGVKDGEIENIKPIIRGVEDKTILVGSDFDYMEGVTANDKEDGDLTSKIVVEGKVDTNKLGEYKLVYKVSDSKAETTTKECIIKVKDKLDDTFSKDKIYLEGDIVIYNGQKYRARWWNQGVVPGSDEVWELINS